MDYAASFYIVAPELILSAAALILLLAAAWVRDAAKFVTIAAVAALFGAAFWTGHLLFDPSFELSADAFGGLYRMDDFGSVAKLLIYLATIACLVVTPRYFEHRRAYRAEYPVLLLLNAVGMGMMVSAVDLMTLYIGLELSSLSSYVLASFLRDDTRSSEAGLKYFILGALASGILLYGMSLVYGFSGTTQYLGIRIAFADGLSTGALFGVVFVLAGLAFKISAVPFHMWTPDVYEGAPTPVTAFFASAPKVAAVAMLVRMAVEAFGAPHFLFNNAGVGMPGVLSASEEALRRSRDGTSPMPRHLIILEVDIVPVAAWAAPKGGGVGGPSTAAASLRPPRLVGRPDASRSAGSPSRTAPPQSPRSLLKP